MKFYLLFICFCMCSTFAQTITTYEGNGSPGKLITSLDQEPYFTGDDILFFQYVESNMYLQSTERTDQGQEFLVVFAFVIDTSGEVLERSVVYSNNLLLDKKFETLLEKMPDWTPAVVDGRKTKVQMFLPVRYRIAESNIICLGYDEWLSEGDEENYLQRIAAIIFITILFIAAIYFQ